jgi:hypothetical protein
MINDKLKQKYSNVLKNKLIEAADDPYFEPEVSEPPDELIDPFARPSPLPPPRDLTTPDELSPTEVERGIQELERRHRDNKFRRWIKDLYYRMRYGRFNSSDLGIPLGNEPGRDQTDPILSPGQGFWFWYNGEWKYFTYQPPDTFVISPLPGRDNLPPGQLYWDHESRQWKREGQDPLFNVGRQLFSYYTLWQLAQRLGFGNAEELYYYLEIANQIATVQGISDAIEFIHDVYPNRGDIILEIFGIKDPSWWPPQYSPNYTPIDPADVPDIPNRPWPGSPTGGW